MAKVINSQEFKNEVLNGEGVVLVDFFATWCGPCKMLAPVLDEIGNEMNGQVTVVKVDVDQSGDLANQFGIMSIPTMITFKDGKPVDKAVGFSSKAVLKAKLQRHV